MLRVSLSQTTKQVCSLQSDIAGVKNDLVSASCILNDRMNSNEGNDREITQFSKSIGSLTRLLTKLESWKNNQMSEIETMRVSVRDTALNISQLKDSETAFKNSVKTKLTDANEQLKGDISRSRADLVTKKDHDASLKSVFAKLKSVEQNPPSKSDCAPLTLAFEKLTSSLNSQLERLCSNIDKALQPLADFTTITPSQAKRSASHVESLHIRSSGCTSIPSETSTSCIRQPSAHLGTSHDAAIQNTTRAPTIQPTQSYSQPLLYTFQQLRQMSTDCPTEPMRTPADAHR